jgi:hypothetical protein
MDKNNKLYSRKLPSIFQQLKNVIIKLAKPNSQTHFPRMDWHWLENKALEQKTKTGIARPR